MDRKNSEIVRAWGSSVDTFVELIDGTFWYLSSEDICQDEPRQVEEIPEDLDLEEISIDTVQDFFEK